MARPASPAPIRDLDVLNEHLDALVALDPRLHEVRAVSGEVPLRPGQRGFAGIATIVNAQQLSVASAGAIQKRFEALFDGQVTGAAYLAHPEDAIRGCGLSRSKYATLAGVAAAERDGLIDYDALEVMPPEEAITALTALKGIGPWTAEIYLLFCLGHPDIFPAGDLALQKMVGVALGHQERPGEKLVREIARDWAPYRGAAARLFWRYFAATKEREGVAL